MIHPALPKHLTLTGRPLLLMPSVLPELHARLNSYTPHTAKLADRLFRRAETQRPPSEAINNIGATRIRAGGLQSSPVMAQPDPYFAHITIEGPLLNKAAPWGDMICVDGYNRIEADISEAMHDPDCAGILLDIDSPGGMVNGCFELSDKIGNWAKEKPIITHTSGLLCSAAYALAAQCSEIHSALTATVGSIGVIYGRYDVTGAMEKEGLKIDFITSGDQKSWGHPETAMSETELTTLQAEINQLADMFFGRVAAGRDMSAEDVKALEAGAFLTQTALTHGLVNSQTDIAGALARLSALAAQSQDPTPIPAPAPEPAATAAQTSTPTRPAKSGTENKETPMSKSPARHRASLAVMLSGTASIMALKLANDADEDELKKAVDEETEEELNAMDDEDITSMDEDDEVEAMDEDDDIEAMDEDELEAMEEEDDPEAEDEAEKPSASRAFKAAASRIAYAAAAKVAAKAPRKPAKTGNAAKDAVTADRARAKSIMALPEARGKEALAAEMAAEGVSIDGAKRMLAKSPKAAKRNFNPPSPKLGTGGKGTSEEKRMASLSDVIEKRTARKKYRV